MAANDLPSVAAPTIAPHEPASADRREANKEEVKAAEKFVADQAQQDIDQGRQITSDFVSRMRTALREQGRLSDQQITATLQKFVDQAKQEGMPGANDPAVQAAVHADEQAQEARRPNDAGESQQADTGSSDARQGETADRAKQDFAGLMRGGSKMPPGPSTGRPGTSSPPQATPGTPTPPGSHAEATARPTVQPQPPVLTGQPTEGRPPAETASPDAPTLAHADQPQPPATPGRPLAGSGQAGQTVASHGEAPAEGLPSGEMAFFCDGEKPPPGGPPRDAMTASVKTGAEWRVFQCRTSPTPAPIPLASSRSEGPRTLADLRRERRGGTVGTSGGTAGTRSSRSLDDEVALGCRRDMGIA